MEISQIYGDLVAAHFDKDPFQINIESQALALDQIQKHLSGGSIEILDVGVGTGELLLALARIYPQAKLSGIDISEQMLEVANKKFAGKTAPEVRFFQDSAIHLLRHINLGSMSLLAGHYIWNYVNYSALLPDLSRALRPKGFLSIASSTYESFPTLHGYAKNFVSEEFIRGEIREPNDLDDWKQILRQGGFQVLETAPYEKRLIFQEFDELHRFVMHSGWLSHPFFTSMSDEQLSFYRDYSRGLFPMEEWF